MRIINVSDIIAAPTQAQCVSHRWIVYQTKQRHRLQSERSHLTSSFFVRGKCKAK